MTLTNKYIIFRFLKKDVLNSYTFFKNIINNNPLKMTIYLPKII